MHFLLIQLSLLIFYEIVFVSSLYNTACQLTCNFPGMICSNNKCKCNPKNALFWTGARCLVCPLYWALSETACIGYYGNKVSWMNAVATCKVMQADLISIRDITILPLIYQITGGYKRRRKRRQIALDKTIAWTSAHAIQLTHLGLYQWNDNTLPKFDSTNSRWCKIGTYLGYYHADNEPTRRIFGNDDAEKCVLFRRGKTAISTLCLDDVVCRHEHPFVCERSESTARTFFGLSPTNMGLSSGSSNIGSTAKPNPTTTNQHHLGALGGKDNKNTKSTIIIVAIILLLLAFIIAGVVCFKKRRNEKRAGLHADGSDMKGNQSSSNVRTSVASSTNFGENNDEDESVSHLESVVEDGLSLDNDVSSGKIADEKQQKNRRGGYSKQNFDELE